MGKAGSTGGASATPEDRQHMTAALTLARRGLGRVAPNPAVGCVLVKAGRVLARGWTQPGGRPHAETEALERAGEAARGATAYVSLEPCAHHGETPPCCEALIAAGITRCVVAMEDPDPRVSGRGIAAMRDAGIAVEVGLLDLEAAEINAGFLLRVLEGRPLVTFKVGSTLDGRIATHSGQSQWITGSTARARSHLLRATNDAVLVGSGTGLIDNPRLDVRLSGLEERAPVRVVLDSRLRLPLTHDLVVRAASLPTILITLEGNDPLRLRAYEDQGVTVLPVAAGEQGRIDLNAALTALGERGITRVLLEGGSHIAAGFLQAGLIDRIIWFRSGRLIGGDGIPAIAGFGIDQLEQAPTYERVSIDRVAEDVMETYRLVS